MGICDVVEAKKAPRAPTDPRASAIVGHRRDFDLARLLELDDAEESVAGVFGLEVGGGPRNEVSYLWGVQGWISVPRSGSKG